MKGDVVRKVAGVAGGASESAAQSASVREEFFPLFLLLLQLVAASSL